MLPHRVAVPERPARYCDRTDLTRRCAPTQRRVTVLATAGGFGKTTLLAAACRAEAARGVPVAWLTLANEGAPTLDAYLAFAFRRAGLGPGVPVAAGDLPLRLPHPRTAILLRALEERGTPCVLALDELERVSDPQSVAVLDALLAGAPPCLHLALACRRLPRGLDAVNAVLDGDAEVLGADDLRFSTPDIARFFDLSLSRRDLARVAETSRGWAIALRISRNCPDPLAANARIARDVVGNWLTGPFWRGFDVADRERVLDAGLFEWFDEALFDEVAQVPGALRRLTALDALAGLLEPLGTSGRRTYRLHPLLREHCAAARGRNPARYRATHRRIAHAYARRGDTVAAMYHATEAGEPALAGDVLLKAGCLQWWLHEGEERLLAAVRYLADDVVAAQPRLAMVRCVALALTDRLPEARRTFEAAMAPVGADLGLDGFLARAVLALNGSESVGSVHAMAAVARQIADSPTVPAPVRAMVESGLAILYNLRGDFDAVAACCRNAQRLGGRRILLSNDLLLGQTAMARGHVREARRRYRAARRKAQTLIDDDLVLAAYADVLARELDLERNRVPADDDGATRLLREARRSGAHFAHHAAASATAVDLVAEADGPAAAVDALDELLVNAAAAALPTYERYLAALRVSQLVVAGRIAEAGHAWRAASLPEDAAGCLETDSQSWREMETVACARLRLLMARGDLAGGRSLGAALIQAAAARNLRRTELRALALLVGLECRARASAAVARNLTHYVRLYARTDYARPLVRAGSAARAALGRLIEDADSVLSDAAGQLLDRCSGGGAAAVPAITGNQRAVLRRLATHSDKEIAKAIGLSTHGVRYHVRMILRKLGATDRLDATRRARALGILLADPG